MVVVVIMVVDGCCRGGSGKLWLLQWWYWSMMVVAAVVVVEDGCCSGGVSHRHDESSDGGCDLCAVVPIFESDVRVPMVIDSGRRCCGGGGGGGARSCGVMVLETCPLSIHLCDVLCYLKKTAARQLPGELKDVLWCGGLVVVVVVVGMLVNCGRRCNMLSKPLRRIR